MQNRTQMKESKCAKDILKCANEKHRVKWCVFKKKAMFSVQKTLYPLLSTGSTHENRKSS